MNLPFLSKRISGMALMLFTRQLSAMIKSGMPLSKSLNIILQQTEDKKVRLAVDSVAKDISSGKSFAESLRKTEAFPEMYCSMSAVGEAGASLDTILSKLASYLEKEEKLKSKIISAMAYPVVIMAISVIVVSILLIFVIPNFSEMFTEAGRELPLPTQIVLSASTFLSDYFILILLLLFAAIFGLLSYVRTPKGRFAFDSFVLSIPILGSLVKKASIARFSSTLGTLLHSGVPLIDAMKITASTAGNMVIENGVLKSLSSITKGREISGPLAETALFPPMVVQMVAVGEETGSLHEMLMHIADFYDTEVDAAVSRMTSVLEPIMILLLGVIVSGMLVAMYLPMFDMVGNIQ
ncbi:MAG: type II secretion system F family protein [Fibrobacteres bacterium]|nr:type II secretion system F family protein [Fibrobacterota bacterium]